MVPDSVERCDRVVPASALLACNEGCMPGCLPGLSAPSEPVAVPVVLLLGLLSKSSSSRAAYAVNDDKKSSDSKNDTHTHQAVSQADSLILD